MTNSAGPDQLALDLRFLQKPDITGFSTARVNIVIFKSLQLFILKFELEFDLIIYVVSLCICTTGANTEQVLRFH